MYRKLSRRFLSFIFFKCRTINTAGLFIGPAWAERVYQEHCKIVVKKKKSRWAVEEVNFLKENYNKMRNIDLGLHLGRTETAVAVKLSVLGLRKGGEYLREIRNTDSGVLARRKLFAQWDQKFAPPEIEED